MVPPASFSEKEPPTHSDDGCKEKPQEVTISSFSRLKVREGGAESKGEDGIMGEVMKEKVFEIRDDSKSLQKNGLSDHHGSDVAKIAIVGRPTATTDPTGHPNNLEIGSAEVPSSTRNVSTGFDGDGIFPLPNSEHWAGSAVDSAVPQAVVVPGSNPIIPSIVKRPPNGAVGSVAVLGPGKTASGGFGGGSASMNANAGENVPPDNNGTNASDDIIDSALLSALSDQRERKGLLRLEQTLVDFMKERNAGYIEVGGPNNSIVINGQSGGARNVGDAPQDGVLPQQMQIVGDGQQYNAGGSGRGGRQTSFQRLCLHRLADRFNIVREPASTPLQGSDGEGFNNGGINNSGGGNVSYPPGLIRLVKVKNSRIPSKLLIDLDLSAYSNPNGNRGAGGGRGLVNPDSIGNSDEQIRGGVPESLPSSSQGETTKSVKKPKKMMIMKRSSSGHGSSGSLRSNGDDYRKGGRNKGKGLKGKNLSDKEKAYEEARARIFNETQSSTSAGGGGTGDEAQNQEGSDSITPFETPPRTASPSSSRSSETGTALSEEQQISSNGKSSSPTNQKPQSQEVVDNSAYDVRIKRENPSPSGPTSSSYQQQAVPAAAATGGAVSKVTWRNRRQEENDPDFRRRGTVRVPVTPGAVGLGGAPSSIAVVNHPMHYGGPPMASAPAAGNFQGIPTMIVQQPQQQQHVYSSQQSQQHYYATQSSAAAPGVSGGAAQTHRHQQQVQAATAAYYAQQHAAAAYYAQSQQQQHHHRSPSPNVSSGQHTRHHHNVQQSRGTTGVVGGYGGGGGNGNGQYVAHGARQWGKHSPDVGSSGSRRTGADSNPQQPTATTAANVYNMEEFPALR
uniref:SUZ domain-containing protein n=1 Tax=Helicotheca tamesis TaxID=374047 RepID=A0A7S2N3F4_9STRA|mmetsp:Transcript_8640/g.11945  ORF Transcript_8640/g.11945 Transcript_8640/m.11945 type:complete len:845 (+) Transcript_8640:213-2747(+)|eukprot:CAMPEP_0185734622 /NCGR_PEP_ID=MMETSP1171-20130828/23046_1 /TAXON_ID=374046 /ORGANISM="Helicotheca tamensis, Strain CCMP826" /LENGTH=844 /DNA_ID=CAMNT_0028404667 /DNA_START=176 /DNA_END=2710 /DNA_ORIENTATION=+